MVNVYAWNYHRIFLIMLFLLILWRILARYIRIDIWKILNLFGAGVSFFLILKFTVLGRTPSSVHQFVVMASYSDEFFRELLMNVFLYFPLGLTLGELIGWHRIWLALVLAIVIESWQYAATAIRNHHSRFPSIYPIPSGHRNVHHQIRCSQL